MLQNSFTSNTPAFYYDSLLLLAEYCLGFDEKKGHIDFLSQQSFSDRMIKEARKAYRSYGIIGIFSSGSKNKEGGPPLAGHKSCHHHERLWLPIGKCRGAIHICLLWFCSGYEKVGESF
jgi:hypothetical protein